MYLGTSLYAETEEELEEISITASRIDVTDLRANVIEASDFADHSQLIDIFALLPNVASSRSGGYGTLSQLRVRGAEANHTKIMIDGVTLNELDGGFNFGVLNSVGIKRIESLNGPLSSVWGSDAMAGVIAFDTRPKDSGAALKLSTGSAGYTDIHGFVDRVKPDDFVALGVSVTGADGYNLSDFGDEKDGFEQRAVNLSGGQSLETLEYRSSVRFNRTQSDYDPFLGNGDYESDIERLSFGSTMTWVDNARWEPSVQISGLSSKSTNLVNGNATNSYEYLDHRLTFVNRFDLQESLKLSMFYEFQAKSFNQSGQASLFGDPNQKQSINSQSLGGELVVRLQATELRFAQRFDDNEQFKQSRGWNVLVNHTIASHKLYFSAGTGYSHPSFIDRFGYTPDTFIGNPNLKSEQVSQAEVGWIKKHQAGEIRIAAFYSQLQNEIDGYVFDPERFAFTSQNIDGESQRHGIELVMNFNLDWGVVRSNLSLIESTEEDLREIRRPRQLGSLFYRSTTWHGYTVQFGIEHNGSQKDKDFSTFPATPETLDSYSLLRASVQKRINNFTTLAIRGENVLDTEYTNVIGINMPTRQLFLTLKFES